MLAWGLATLTTSLHRFGFVVLVALPQIWAVAMLLRRHCYPTTTIGHMLRTASLSAGDAAAPPRGAKWIIALVAGVQAGLALHLALWIVAWTWQIPAGNSLWFWPGLAALLFPALTLAWCGTLEHNSRYAAIPVPLLRPPAEEIAWGGIVAGFAVLLFWLPVIGLVFAGLACWANRHSSRWPRRASQISLALTLLVHAVLGLLLALGK